MAIDTAAKRLSAAATRRLPWLRRFAIPQPDNTIDQGDRQMVGFVYRGILAGAAAAQTYGPGHFAELFAIYPGLKEAAAIHPGLQEIEVHW